MHQTIKIVLYVLNQKKTKKQKKQKNPSMSGEDRVLN